MSNRTSLYLKTPEQLKALDQLADDLNGTVTGQRGSSRNIMIQKIADAYMKEESTTLYLMEAIIMIADGEDVSEVYSFSLKVDKNLEREIF